VLFRDIAAAIFRSHTFKATAPSLDTFKPYSSNYMLLYFAIVKPLAYIQTASTL
jgi:hypothetical protein